MISLENLKRYCRTCLVQLESSIKDGTQKYVSTKEYPKLEHLIQVCISKTNTDDDNLCYYVPCLCRSCFEKWLDFLKLYELAMVCDEKIRMILENGVLKTNEYEKNVTNTKEKENFDEYFTNSVAVADAKDRDTYEIPFPKFTKKVLPSKKNKHINDSTLLDSELKSKISNNIELLSEHMDDNYETDSSLSNKIYDDDFTPEVHSNKQKESPCMPNKQNDSKARVEIHSDENNGLKKVRYKCEPCNKYFWKQNKYDGHLKQVHEGIRRPYQCHQCHKAYNLYKTLLQHKRECHGEKSQEYKCEKCAKVFKTAVILKQHFNNKHSEQRESMRSICDQCGFIAAHQYSLSRHIINKHTETDQIKCEQCPKVFKTQYSLKYHVLGNHNPSNNKPYKCSECQMGFTRKTLLNQHKRTHLKYTERIKCDFEGCEVRFVKLGDKTHHMRLVHLKIKQHICDFCGEAFGALQTLRHHRFIHTGEKPYKCNFCGQGFRQRTAMKTHSKTHFGRNTEKQNITNNLK